MILCDVNILIYAFRSDADRHPEFRTWFESRLDGEEPFGFSELALSGFIRIVTNPRAFRDPNTPAEAFAFANSVRS